MSDVELFLMQAGKGGQLRALPLLEHIRAILAEAPAAKLREKTDAR
ncbi:hypothetical protein [Tropicibacter alexandrii]|nr:hypothetical protein [Tropicibacter alexandrii]